MARRAEALEAVARLAEQGLPPASERKALLLALESTLATGAELERRIRLERERIRCELTRLREVAVLLRRATPLERPKRIDCSA